MGVETGGGGGGGRCDTALREIRGGGGAGATLLSAKFWYDESPEKLCCRVGNSQPLDLQSQALPTRPAGLVH